jgi:hypothetical protein
LPRVRKELLRGLAVLGLFFVLIVANDLFFPYSVEQAGYTVVDIRRLEENPLPLEGQQISSSATINAIFDNGTFFTVTTVEGVRLIFPTTVGHPLVDERVLFRGTSWIGTNDSILVHEFYAFDYSSSLIRSAPGIALFVILFFTVFKINLGRLAFVLRGEEHA